MALTGIVGATESTALTIPTGLTGYVYSAGNEWKANGITLSTNTDGDLVLSNATFAELVSSNTTTTIAFTINLSDLTFPTVDRTPFFTLSNASNETIAVTYRTSGNKRIAVEPGSDLYSSGGSFTYTADEDVLRTYVLTLSSSGIRVFQGDSATYWSNAGKATYDDLNSLIIESWFLEGLESMAIWSGVSSYSGGDSVTAIINYTEAIPEPTTATFSLLALAGLAARRRRR